MLTNLWNSNLYTLNFSLYDQLCLLWVVTLYQVQRGLLHAQFCKTDLEVPFALYYDFNCATLCLPFVPFKLIAHKIINSNAHKDNLIKKKMYITVCQIMIFQLYAIGSYIYKLVTIPA